MTFQFDCRRASGRFLRFAVKSSFNTLSLSLGPVTLHTTLSTELYYLSALSAGQQMLLLPCSSADAAATVAAAAATSREHTAGATL